MLVFRRGWTRLVLASALVAPLAHSVGAQSSSESAGGPARAVGDAEDPAQAIRGEIDQLKKDFDARMAALEARLAALEGGAKPPPPSPAAPAIVEVPAGAAGAGGGILPAPKISLKPALPATG